MILLQYIIGDWYIDIPYKSLPSDALQSQGANSTQRPASISLSFMTPFTQIASKVLFSQNLTVA